MSQELAEIIELTESRFTSIAPSYMKYASEKGFAIQLISNSDKLKEAAASSPSSLQKAITNIASIGLSLNPAEKLAYLIPRSVKIKTDSGDKWEKRVYLEPSYIGLIRLATNTGSIEWVQAKIVRSDDQFTDNGLGIRPTHTYKAFGERGDIVGVFCTAKTGTGDYLTSIMDLNQIRDIQGRSASNSGPWITDFEEMAKKAVIRNAFKTWPLSDERRLAEAVHLSNENEGFEPINFPQASNDAQDYFNRLIETSDALRMYVFKQTFGFSGGQSENQITAWGSLFNHFPKGTKIKNTELVNDLCKKGENIFMDYLSVFVDALSNDDQVATNELLSELDSDVVDLLKENLSYEESLIFSQMKG